MLSRSNHTLLYVEDEDFTRRMAVAYLRSYFQTIYEARNGKEALALYREHQPDMMITDIEMPHMNGLDLCKMIRQEDRTTPIIITTAYTDTAYLLEAVSLNLIKYLVKPIKEEELQEAISICFKRLADKDDSIVSFAKDLKFDSFNRTLLSGETLVKLTESQYKLLTILIQNRGRIVSYQEIEHFIWFDKVMSSDALRSLVRDVRKVIGKERIENISKYGYRIHLDG